MFKSKFISIFIVFNLVLAGVLLVNRIQYVFAKVNNQYTIVDSDTLNGDKLDQEDLERFKEKFLIIYDDRQEATITNRINENLTQILTSIDKSYDMITDEQLTDQIDLWQYKGVLINQENIDFLTDGDFITSYIKEGGTVAFLQRPLLGNELEEYKEYLGINSVEEYKVVETMVLTSNILIQGNGFEYLNAVGTHALDAKLTDECDILVSSKEEVPLVWQNDVEDGKVLVANGQFLSERANKGLLLGFLTYMSDTFAYPIINAKVLHMDDYPLPLPEGTAEIIYNDYQVDNEEFFYYIWWPDVVRITQKYNVIVNGYLIYNYENDVADVDLLLNDSERANHLLLQGENLIKAGGELALHGFNHQPLRMREYLPEEAEILNYKTWSSVEDMVDSISNLDKYLANVYPNYTAQAYVAPSNILTEEGRRALKLALPDLKVICALFDSGGVESNYQQDFGLGEDGIYDFPRYSSGYMLTEESNWLILNGITLNGVFSHFVHPDDVLDPDRNYGGLGWKVLSEEFDKFMNYLVTDFPWLNSTSVSQATNLLAEYVESKSYFNYEENQITGYIEDGTYTNYYIIRTDKEIISSTGCDFQEIDEEIYLVTANSNQFNLILGE